MEKYQQLAKVLNEDIEDLKKLLEEKEYQALFADVLALDTYFQQQVFANLPQGDYHLKVEMHYDNHLYTRSSMKIMNFGLESAHGYQSLISKDTKVGMESLAMLYFKSFKDEIVRSSLQNMLSQTSHNTYQLSKDNKVPFEPDQTYKDNEKIYHPVKLSKHLPDVSFWLEFIVSSQHEAVLRVQDMVVEENRELRHLKNIL